MPLAVCKQTFYITFRLDVEPLGALLVCTELIDIGKVKYPEVALLVFHSKSQRVECYR